MQAILFSIRFWDAAIKRIRQAGNQEKKKSILPGFLLRVRSFSSHNMLLPFYVK
jgi:hypothetical protein